MYDIAMDIEVKNGFVGQFTLRDTLRANTSDLRPRCYHVDSELERK